MNKNIFFGVLCVLFLALCSSAEAQQLKIARIGILSSGSPATSKSLVDAFRQGLHDLGYIEGQNIRIEYRWAEGQEDRYPVLAAEMAGLRLDIIVTAGTTATLAANRATGTIPIVAGSAGDLVGAG